MQEETSRRPLLFHTLTAGPAVFFILHRGHTSFARYFLSRATLASLAILSRIENRRMADSKQGCEKQNHGQEVHILTTVSLLSLVNTLYTSKS